MGADRPAAPPPTLTGLPDILGMLPRTGLRHTPPPHAPTRQGQAPGQRFPACQMSKLSNERAIDLLQQARQGEVEAIRQLYMACSIVYPHVLKMCRDPVLAKEVFFDTVTEIWKGPSVFRGDSQFSTWVIAIARNLALGALRARAPHAGAPAGPVPQEDAFDDERSAHGDADAGMDPFDAMAQQQHREGVLRCIRKLSPKLGECLLLVYYAELSQPQVAALLGLNINTVKARVRDAHLKVKACLGLLLGGGGRHD